MIFQSSANIRLNEQLFNPQIQNLYDLNQFKSLVKKIQLHLFSTESAFFFLKTLKHILHNQGVDIGLFL